MRPGGEISGGTGAAGMGEGTAWSHVRTEQCSQKCPEPGEYQERQAGGRLCLGHVIPPVYLGVFLVDVETSSI